MTGPSLLGDSDYLRSVLAKLQYQYIQMHTAQMLEEFGGKDLRAKIFFVVLRFVRHGA